jgi:hypothetical protein
MTDRLVQSVRTALDGRRIGNLRWRARTLNARGPGPEEKRQGADVLGALEIDLEEYKVKKGFLWQAKVIERGQRLSAREWERLQDQCRTLLERWHDSFAVISSREEGVRFIPAQEILEIKADQVHDLGSRMFGFFRRT